jgi:diguanylate cyclase (GGDEF)-like protein
MLIGRSHCELLGLLVPDVLNLTDGLSGNPIASALEEALSRRRIVSCEGRSVLVNAEQHKVAVEERASPMFDRNGNLIGGVLCFRDVSAAREYLQRRSWEASHDMLTGLVNRREFEGRLKTALSNAQLGVRSYVVCYMDLDRFKVVNDSGGHVAGDELLIQLTRLMRLRVRDSDTLARLGGDEFGLLLDGCDTQRGQLIANELLTAVTDFQFSWDGSIYTVGLSVGLTVITSENLSVAEVLGEADSACYWAKEQGRNRVCVYQASDLELVARRSEMSWVGRIMAALNENRFVLYHQTYSTLNTKVSRCLHLEVLLRMITEDDEIIAPGRFLPAAERYNLMPDIDRWVINKVFCDYHQLCALHAGTMLMININLSGTSLSSPALLDYIEQGIEKYQVDPATLCFEVTETVAVKHLQSAIEFIHSCKKMGIKFALDDFGTGTSSFGYLRDLPVDYLKIDGSFVRNLEHDPVDRAMTESINRIGHLMGKITVAEFAENDSTIAILREIGVDFAQGYGVCIPKPLLAS